MSGMPVYSSKTRVGNWNEDIARNILAAKDYEARRVKGELLHLKKAREKTFQTQTVSFFLLMHGFDVLLLLGHALCDQGCLQLFGSPYLP
jgi:hypothetical protein